METNKPPAIGPAPQAKDPPEDWVAHSSLGFFMAFNATPTGPLVPLVRLADVMHWLEKSQSLPRVATLEALCDAMHPVVMQWLYWVQPGDHATPVPVDHMWGYQTAEQIEAQKAQNMQDALQSEFENERNGQLWAGRRVREKITPITTEPTEPTEPGLPALLQLLRRRWTLAKRNKLSTFDILDDPREVPLVNLAIRLDKAAVLWGYGRIKTDQAIEAVSGAVEWTGKTLKEQQTVLKQSGVKAHTQKLSEMSGLTEREIRRRINASSDLKPVFDWNVTSITNGKKKTKISKA